MDWNTLDEATIKEREREYGGKYRKLYEVVDRLEKDPNLSTKQIMALPDLQFALIFFDMPGIMADYWGPTGEICKITTSERQKDGYGWLDMDWVWNKVVEFEEDYNLAELQTLIDRLLQSIPNNSPQETKEQVKESLEVIQTEVQSHAPRKDIIKTKLAELGNGIIKAVDFLVNLATLAKFLGM